MARGNAIKCTCGACPLCARRGKLAKFAQCPGCGVARRRQGFMSHLKTCDPLIHLVILCGERSREEFYLELTETLATPDRTKALRFTRRHPLRL